MSITNSKYCRLFFCLSLLLSTAASRADDIQAIRDRGYIDFAVYDDFFPFSYIAGDTLRGIDVDIGRTLAERLGVRVRFRMIQADESVADDLRNAIWKGHYLGGGVADAMLHAPYDPDFSARIKQVAFVAPYYREELMVAMEPELAGRNAGLVMFATEKIAVETATLADDYLLLAFNGGLRHNVVHFPRMRDAIESLLQKRVAAVMGPRTQLEAGLGKYQHHYRVVRMEYPALSQAAWDLGIAVNADREELASKLDLLIGELRSTGVLDAIFTRHRTTYARPRGQAGEAGIAHAVESN